MIEKQNEHGLDLHTLFIDFKDAFDSINRKRLFEAMNKMGIPQKLIRLSRMTVSNQGKSENRQSNKSPLQIQ